MKLNELIASLDVLERSGCADNLDIAHLSINSKEVVPGTLFFAIPGLKTDGHKYIDSALENGAVAVIYSTPQAHYKEDVAYLRVENPRHALGLCASAFYGHPTADMTTIGVTGTNGKTSVTMMLKHILAHAGRKTGLIGTIHNEIGDEIVENGGRTTPDAIALQEVFREMKDADCEDVCMEVSSHALALERVNGVDFDYGAFTNLTHEHLDFHHTMEAYFEAKAKLFFMTSKGNVINIDDPWGRKLYDALREQNRPVKTYALEQEGDYRAIDCDYTIKGTTFTLVLPNGEKHPFFLSILGEFNVYNALAAIGVALEMGIDLATVHDALGTMPTVEGRMERVDLPVPYDVVIDYAHTPDGLEKLLLSMRKIFKDERIFLMFGCNGDRDKEKRPIMGEIAGRLADYIVVTSDNPASENPQDIADVVSKAVRAVNENCEVVINRWDAVDYAVTLPHAGDVLVLAGKGHEKQETMATENLYYNEWEAVKEAVQKMQDKKSV